MKREIKFRGKSKMSIKEMDELEIPHQNGWVKGHLVGDLIVFDQQIESYEEYIYPRWWAPVEPETVGQFTGLLDKNGVEVFEGDIIGDWTDVDGEQVLSRCPVFFDETLGEWMIDLNHGKEIHIAYSLSSELNEFYYEVIGNIYEKTETKFNTGDEVWFMINNKAERGVVESENEHHAMVKREAKPPRCIKISRIFKTKEELIESLFN